MMCKKPRILCRNHCVLKLRRYPIQWNECIPLSVRQALCRCVQPSLDLYGRERWIHPAQENKNNAYSSIEENDGDGRRAKNDPERGMPANFLLRSTLAGCWRQLPSVRLIPPRARRLAIIEREFVDPLRTMPLCVACYVARLRRSRLAFGNARTGTRHWCLRPLPAGRRIDGHPNAATWLRIDFKFPTKQPRPFRHAS